MEGKYLILACGARTKRNSLLKKYMQEEHLKKLHKKFIAEFWIVVQRNIVVNVQIYKYNMRCAQFL